MSAKPKSIKKTRLLIVDDHPMVRERISELIQQQPDLEVCAEAESVRDAIKAVQTHHPDMAIVDITLKDSYGIELIKQLKEINPKLLMLVVSMHDESMYGERALRAGAKGYLAKHEASKKIIDAIRRILRGEIYVSEELNRVLLQKVAGAKSAQGESAIDVLTDRELEVFQLLGQGIGVRDIAERLFVSTKTVEAHRENIKQKLKFKTSSELLRFAIQYCMHGK
ncbi:MAG TPA: response regulator transcription factor [Tepidisphaeraceae bacterium]|nr:response regulator transcription factor [Tepidisphaeraceae bacterium]